MLPVLVSFIAEEREREREREREMGKSRASINAVEREL